MLLVSFFQKCISCCSCSFFTFPASNKFRLLPLLLLLLRLVLPIPLPLLLKNKLFLPEPMKIFSCFFIQGYWGCSVSLYITGWISWSSWGTVWTRWSLSWWAELLWPCPRTTGTTLLGRFFLLMISGWLTSRYCVLATSSKCGSGSALFIRDFYDPDPHGVSGSGPKRQNSPNNFLCL